METPRPGPDVTPPVAEPEIPRDDSRIIADLAGKMQFVGLVTMVLGIVVLLYGFFALVNSVWNGGGPPPSSLIILGAGAVFTAFGFWTRRAGYEFELVDETTGHDVTHVMVAVINLTKLYTWQYWLCVGGIVFFVLVIVFAFSSDVAR